MPLGALGLRGRLDELRRGRVPRVGRARGGFRAAADVEGSVPEEKATDGESQGW